MSRLFAVWIALCTGIIVSLQLLRTVGGGSFNSNAINGRSALFQCLFTEVTCK